MQIYIVMETVDLGGNTVVAYSDKIKAEADVLARNTAARETAIKNLISHCGYTQEQAAAYSALSNSYYVEEVELR